MLCTETWSYVIKLFHDPSVTNLRCTSLQFVAKAKYLSYNLKCQLLVNAGSTIFKMSMEFCWDRLMIKHHTESTSRARGQKINNAKT